VRDDKIAPNGIIYRTFAAAAGVGLRFVVEMERGKPTVQLGRTLAVLAAAGLEVRRLERETTFGAAPRLSRYAFGA
jgi:hypothetical protein